MLTLTGIAHRSTWKSMIPQGLESMHPDVGALWLQTTILKYMSESIACQEITVRKCSNPWLNKRVERAVQEKAQAAPDERNAANKRCNAVIKEEHQQWLARSKAQLANMPSESKEWWKQSQQVAIQKEQVWSIHALKDSNGQCVISSQAKLTYLLLLSKQGIPCQSRNKMSIRKYMRKVVTINCRTLSRTKTMPSKYYSG